MDNEEYHYLFVGQTYHISHKKSKQQSAVVLFAYHQLFRGGSHGGTRTIIVFPLDDKGQPGRAFLYQTFDTKDQEIWPFLETINDFNRDGLIDYMHCGINQPILFYNVQQQQLSQKHSGYRVEFIVDREVSILIKKDKP